MAGMLGKAGSYMFARKASKEFDDFSSDVSSLTNSIGEGASRFINKMRGTYILLGNEPPGEWISNENEREICKRLTGFWYTAGKVQTPLPELLQTYQIPKGVFPKNVLNYEFDETTGKLIVLLPFICEVRYKDDSIVRFDKRITGNLSTGVFKNIEGMKTKMLMRWSKLISVTMDSPEATKVVFVSSMNKSRPRDAYIVLRDGIEVGDF